MAQANYLYYNIILLKIGGLYRTDKFKSIRSKMLQYFCSIFCVSIITLLFGIMCVEIIEKGVFEFSANALAYAFLGGIICALQRSIYYCMHGNKLSNLVTKMNNIFMYKTETLMEERSIENCLSLIKKLTFTWLIYAELFILMFCLYPVYTKLHKERVLPLPMWIPYDYKSSPTYELTYFVETACLLVTTFIQTSMDMFFAAILLLTAEQFKILGWELKNLLFTKLVENGVPKEIVSKFMVEFNGVNFNGDRNVILPNVSIAIICINTLIAFDFRKLKETDVRLIYDLCYSEKFNDDVVRSSKKLINFHQSLLMFCIDLENFFSPMMLLFYSFLMVTALFLNFVVVSTKDMSILLQCLPINLAIYFDIFVPCFFANVLTTQAEKLRQDAYELPWYIFNKKFKINFIFVLHKMNVPIGLTMGKFSILGLPLFLWAVRTVNSYCVVLYQVYQTN